MALGEGVREARTTTGPPWVGGGCSDEAFHLSPHAPDRAALRLEPVHLSDLVCRVVGLMDGAGQRVHVLLEHVPTVMADRDKLALAVAKLLGNALAYSPPEQPVEVEVAGRCLAQEAGSLVVLEGMPAVDPSHALPAEPFGMSLGTKPQGEACRPAVSVALRDLGPGLSPEELRSALVPVAGAHGSRQLPEAGGPGLAVAGAIVDRHRGRLWARSRPGRGSAFGFCLSAAALASEEAA